VTYPKIELHVHVEGTVRPATLLELARRNDHPLPVDTEEELEALYEFRDFPHFIEVFTWASAALCTAGDFRQILVDYAQEAVSHGAVYLEVIFSPGLWRGVDSDELFSGYCDGADEARELHGLEIRLTPDIPRVYTLDQAQLTARYAVKYRDRGIVGIGLGGPEAGNPPEPYASAFAIAREGGLASVPHAGEVVGPESIRGALDVLHADRLRHGIRAVDDPELVEELAERGIVLDVCPVSNVRTRAVPSLEEHPLPQLVGAGVRCSISTDDPAMFGTDLSKDCAAAASLGLDPEAMFTNGLHGALCDEETKERLREIGRTFDWGSLHPLESQIP
jgi:aminodeoxyfutalosine deaminase